MAWSKRIGFCVALCAGLLIASNAAAQQSLSGVAGAVRDAAGAPVAGVTVEAASPALIERVRTVVTDGQGQYKIFDLQPGIYSVTFRAPGFNALRTEGLELGAGFTGTVNGDLKAGNPNETITVTAVSSSIDTRGNTQASVISSETQSKLASGTQDAQSVAKLAAGVTGGTDVGGSSGSYSAQGNSLTVRGKAGVKRLFDGLRVENMEGNGSTSYMVNSAIVQSSVVETGGGNAESLAAGGTINSVPKAGSNNLRWGLAGLYSNENFQGDNLDDELRARGVTVVNKVGSIWDTSLTVGGPIKKDKLWYFLALRKWGNRNYSAGVYWNDTQGTPFYTPANGTGIDVFGVQRAPAGLPIRRGDQFEDYRNQPLRLTWQANQKNKFNFVVDYPDSGCTCRNLATTSSPESVSHWWFGHYPDFWGISENNYGYGLFQTTWSSPRTSKLLMEAGWSWMLGSWPEPNQPTVTNDHISINDSGLGFRYNAPASMNGPRENPQHQSDRMAERFSVSYVTGSHAMKFGVQDEQGFRNAHVFAHQALNYNFNNGVPTQVVQYATPYTTFSRIKHDLGIYGQDQWTIKRLTLNYGLRFSYFNAFNPEQHADPTRFIPTARDFPENPCVPCWKDLDPRFGMAYDVFGNGRTAFKVTTGKFVAIQVVSIANAANPFATSVNSVTRPWNDRTTFAAGDPRNGNYVPDCDLTNPLLNGECGNISDFNFGKNNPRATTYSPDVINGYGNRGYLWDFSTEISHQFTPRLAINGGYYRNTAGNFNTTDNTAWDPSDFSPFCVTTPIDSRLPGGGGQELCGLYDISAEKRSSVTNVINKSENYGKQTTVNNFLGAQFTGRFKRDIRAGASFDIGKTTSDSCFVVFSPAQEIYTVSATNGSASDYCLDEKPWVNNMQIKLNGSVPVGYGFSVSPTLQNLPGTNITATWAAPNSVVTGLGRNLASCPLATGPCNQTISVPLVRNWELNEPRRTQVDVRVSKSLRLTPKIRSQWNLDVYNLTNNNAVTSLNTTYAPPPSTSWLRPTRTLDARLLQISGRIDF